VLVVEVVRVQVEHVQGADVHVAVLWRTSQHQTSGKNEKENKEKPDIYVAVLHLPRGKGDRDKKIRNMKGGRKKRRRKKKQEKKEKQGFAVECAEYNTHS